MVDAILVGIIAVMLAFVFAVYLFLRRIATDFKQGVKQGRDNRR
ncbi:MAG: hypothetical protein ABEI77_10005 [Halorientalis sp.]